MEVRLSTDPRVGYIRRCTTPIIPFEDLKVAAEIDGVKYYHAFVYKDDYEREQVPLSPRAKEFIENFGAILGEDKRMENERNRVFYSNCSREYRQAEFRQKKECERQYKEIMALLKPYIKD